ncbi:MAG TPA: DegV family protein [Halococcus sp.]|nr:DegV family protein [Halococcus sp.]
MRAAFVINTLSIFEDRTVVDEHPIFEVPMHLTNGDWQYPDDGPVRADEKYDAVQTAWTQGCLRGSPPPAETYREQFKKAFAAGDAVYVFLPGEELMGSAAARIGRQLAEEKGLGRLRVWQHETMPSAGPLLAVLSARLAADTDSAEHLEAKIDSLAEHTTGVMTFPHFNDIVGNMSHIEHYRDRPFEIYPVVTGGEDGVIDPITAVCTEKQVCDEMVEFAKQEATLYGNGSDGPVAYGVIDMFADSARGGLRKRLREEFPDAEEIGPFKPGRAWSMVAGEGAFGVTFCHSLPEDNS